MCALQDEQLFVSDSDEFEDDSLNGSIPDSLDGQDGSPCDLNEIPESPLAYNNSSPVEQKRSLFEFDSVKQSSNSSKNSTQNLPTVILQKDQIDKEMILDYRSSAMKKLNKHPGVSFGSIKFKDFKKAQKAKESQSSQDSLAIETPSQPKKAKGNINTAHVDSKLDTNLVSKNMLKVKRTLNLLNKRVDEMQAKHQIKSNKQRLLKTRQSIFPEQATAIVDDSDESMNGHSDIPSDCDEIPDSLENSQDEIAESDLEDEQKSNSMDSSGKQFIRSRQTINPKNGNIIYANNSFEEENTDKPNLATNESFCTAIEETFYGGLTRNSSSDSLEEPTETCSQKSLTKSSNEQNSSQGQMKMKLFKKKQNTNFATKFNHKDVHSDDDLRPKTAENKMLHSPVRKKNERKQLLGFMCKQCQDYYSNRNLSEEEMNKLIQDCSRHRAHHSPYRSPKKFWETDFSATPEATTARPKGAKSATKTAHKPISHGKSKHTRRLQLDLYRDWEEDIDSNSRQSNVLHSTKLDI